ncbi:MAG: glycosyltransferase family 2 protein [Acidobacteriota bacterium]|nr:glycosyltransferase family 2 protein [Acidobacteriota bacterium]
MGRLAISVVIPTYNRRHRVVRAVESALAQCAIGDEVIVVDDGSTDRTGEALERYGRRIRYLRVPNGGAGKARNIGVDAATKPLVAFLDSDDEWMPGKLPLHREFMMARPDVLFTFSDFAHLRHDGTEEHHCLRYWHEDPRPWDEILAPGVTYSSITSLPTGRADFRVHVGDLYLAEMAASYVFTSTLVVRREEAGDALSFAEDLSVYEDWECYGKLAGAGKGAYFACETAWQHGHDEGRLTDADALVTTAARLTVLRRVWGSDRGFMRRHRDSFEATVQEQHRARARAFIVHGRTREARDVLRVANRAPLHYRLLSWMPGPVVRSLVTTRRALLNRQTP